MHRLIKATCMIAAEDIGKVRAERIAANRKGAGRAYRGKGAEAL